MSPGMDEVELEAVAYDHPDVVALTAQVQDYYREIYGGPDVAPLEVGEVAPPEGLFLLARLDGAPVGMGGWRRLPGRDGVRAEVTAEVRRMFTVPQVRHRGVARALLTTLERSAADAGCHAVVLSTGFRQPDAIAFYRACGYADVPAFGHWAGAPGAVFLGRSLP